MIIYFFFWEHVQLHVIEIRITWNKYLSFTLKVFMLPTYKVHVPAYI